MAHPVFPAAGRLLVVALLTVLVTGCVSQTVKTVRSDPLASAETIPEQELLDIGVLLFDPNIPEDWDERERQVVMPELRRAEARYMPQLLKTTLQNSGNWGAVRVLPRHSNAVDLSVTGKILHSDGETLALHVEVVDATGREWIDEDYRYRTSKYAYDQDERDAIDPFQALYTEIANDMLDVLQQLGSDQRTRIRTVAEMRFAEDFAPEKFDPYVEQDNGRWELERLPAESDPMVSRIRQVREREYLFVDTLDEYYNEFRRDMEASYDDYRRYTYEEAVQLREMRESARRRTLAGAVGVVGGLAAAVASDDSTVRTAGALATIGGAYDLKIALDKRTESQMHVEAIRELASSMESEVMPHVIELDDRTWTLTGTVDEQYDEWQDILRELYRSEMGLPPASAEAGGTTAGDTTTARAEPPDS